MNKITSLVVCILVLSYAVAQQNDTIKTFEFGATKKLEAISRNNEYALLSEYGSKYYIYSLLADQCIRSFSPTPGVFYSGADVSNNGKYTLLLKWGKSKKVAELWGENGKINEWIDKQWYYKSSLTRNGKFAVIHTGNNEAVQLDFENGSFKTIYPDKNLQIVDINNYGNLLCWKDKWMVYDSLFAPINEIDLNNATGASFSDDGNLVLSWNDGGGIKVWDIKAQKEILSFKVPYDTVWIKELSLDNKLALLNTKNKGITKDYIYDLVAKRVVYILPDGLVAHGFFNNNNELLCRRGRLNNESTLYLLDFSKYVPARVVEYYVNEKLTSWQQKSEFESTSEYLERITEVNRKKAMDVFQNEIITTLSKKDAKNYEISSFVLNRYDADNESYLLNSKDRNYVIPVRKSDARKFKDNFIEAHVSNHKFILTDEGLKLSSFDVVVPNLGTYSWSHTTDNPYQQTAVNYNFEKAEINLSTAQTTSAQKSIEVKHLTVGKSDVDVDIPAVSGVNSNTFAVVIGNENYSNEIKVEYALNDARIFKEYLQKTLGLPANNINYKENATFGTILDALKWANDITKVYKGDAKLIFYYAGHGMPDEETKSAYILPVDGNSKNMATSVRLADIYSKLTEHSSKSVTVFLDACFSGATREASEAMLAEGRSVKIKPQNEPLTGKAVVLSATTGEETALPYAEKQHGLFTYFLLKKLKETKGNTTLSELSSYIISNVSRQSVVVNRKSQTPQVNYSAGAAELWSGWSVR